MRTRENARVRLALVVLLAAFLVNVPLVHSTWTDHRVASQGVHVQATVVDHSSEGGDHFVSFRFPRSVDADQRTWTAQVDAATYAAAVRDGSVGVKVLEDDPASYTVDGEVGSSALVVVTVVADVILVLVALLLWRYGRRRPQLRSVALEDVARAAPGTALERLEVETYLVRGEVIGMEPGQVVIDVGGRSVLVLLDGHRNPVGYQQPAEVRVRLI